MKGLKAIEIENLWFMHLPGTKSKIKVKNIVDNLKEGCCFPPIKLNICPDGEVEILDGYHRVIGLWLFGEKVLKKNEYCITKTKFTNRIRIGKIGDIIDDYV